MTPINSSLLRLVRFIYSLVLGVFLLPPGGSVSVWKSLHNTNVGKRVSGGERISLWDGGPGNTSVCVQENPYFPWRHDGFM